MNNLLTPVSGYAEDTEVKTNHGWKYFDEINPETDKVLTLDIGSFAMEYMPILAVRHGHTKSLMYQFNHNTVDMLVTEGKPLLAKSHITEKPWRILPAEKVRASHLLPLRGFKYKNPQYTMGGQFSLPPILRNEGSKPEEHTVPLMAWLEFFGFWLTCGYCQKREEAGNGTVYAVGIKRRKDDDAYILRLFRDIGFPAVKYRKDGYDHFETNAEQLYCYLQSFGEEENRYIPDEFLELDTPYLEHLLLGCEMGRTRIYDDFIVYMSRSFATIQGIQELILKIYGMIGQIRSVYVRQAGKDVKFWYIRACTNDSIARRTTQFKQIDRVQFEGEIFEIYLKNNNRAILVSRNDTVSWGGCSAL